MDMSQLKLHSTLNSQCECGVCDKWAVCSRCFPYRHDVFLMLFQSSVININHWNGVRLTLAMWMM